MDAICIGNRVINIAEWNDAPKAVFNRAKNIIAFLLRKSKRSQIHNKSERSAFCILESPKAQ